MSFVSLSYLCLIHFIISDLNFSPSVLFLLPYPSFVQCVSRCLHHKYLFTFLFQTDLYSYHVSITRDNSSSIVNSMSVPSVQSLMVEVMGTHSKKTNENHYNLFIHFQYIFYSGQGLSGSQWNLKIIIYNLRSKFIYLIY